MKSKFVESENVHQKRKEKIIELTINEEDFIETATEIKYKTLFLDKFPIKYRNFSQSTQALNINNVGFAEVDFGFTKIYNMQIRIVEYPKFKMIELKKRDFKLSLGVNAEGTLLLRSNDLFEYEISDNIKNNRLRNILEFFVNLFSGCTIKFHFSNIVCDLDFVNHIEAFKFNNILEILNSYETLVNTYSLNRNKDLTSSKTSFYALSLLNTELHNDFIDTWINLKIKKPIDLEAGDKLILNRLHKFNLKNLSFDILEKIYLRSPLTERELLNNKIDLNKKTVKITLEKVKK